MSTGAERQKAYYQRTRLLPVKYLLQNAKRNARVKGLDFNISVEDFPYLPTHCPALGIELVYGSAARSDASASIDRIDSTLGYVRGNVQVLSNRANTIKSNSTTAELLQVAQYMRKLHPAPHAVTPR